MTNARRRRRHRRRRLRRSRRRQARLRRTTNCEGRPDTSGRLSRSKRNDIMAKRDYYEILGVSEGRVGRRDQEGLSPEGERASPRPQLRQPEAEAQFKEANEAYEVLKDADKKAAYDRFGHAAFEGGMGGGRLVGGGQGDFASAFSDVFDDLFRRLYGRTRRRWRRSARGARLGPAV